MVALNERASEARAQPDPAKPGTEAVKREGLFFGSPAAGGSLADARELQTAELTHIIHTYPQQLTKRKKEAKKEKGTADDGSIPSGSFLRELTRLTYCKTRPLGLAGGGLEAGAPAPALKAATCAR